MSQIPPKDAGEEKAISTPNNEVPPSGLSPEIERFLKIETIRAELIQKDVDYEAFGHEQARIRAKYRDNSSDPWFQAGAEKMLSFVRLEANAKAKSSEALYNEYANERDKIGKELHGYEEEVENEAPYERKVVFFLVLAGILILFGELPLAFSTFTDLVKIGDSSGIQTSKWLPWLMACAGAVGLVATLASFKVVLSYVFELSRKLKLEKLQPSNKSRKRSLNDGRFWGVLVVGSAATICFFLFMVRLGEYRSESARLKERQDRLDVAQDPTLNIILDTTKILSLAKEIEGLESILGPLEGDLFMYYGLLFPLGSALFFFEAWVIRIHRKRLILLERKRAELSDKSKELDDKTLQAKLEKENAQAIDEALKNDSQVREALVQRFWFHYSIGYHKSLFIPHKHSPSILDLTERFRLTSNF